eukprot:337759-Amphidinium_carterae.1
MPDVDKAKRMFFDSGKFGEQVGYNECFEALLLLVRRGLQGLSPLNTAHKTVMSQKLFTSQKSFAP